MKSKQISVDDVMILIEEYQKKYRNIDLEKFVISGIYDLFPHQKNSLKSQSQWPDPWLNLGKAGVYIFLDKTLNVLYIGKTSWNSTFERRLSSYFAYGENKRCKLKHDSWKGTPKYVITIAVPDSSKFEASSFEEYLIINLKPSNNVIGSNTELNS